MQRKYFSILGKRITEDCQLCFGAAAGCFLLGTAGTLLNAVLPGTTTLNALLVVGVFYSLLGVIELCKKDPAASGEGGTDRDRFVALVPHRVAEHHFAEGPEGSQTAA